jgi:membrane-associated phospholipid phosphatase
MRISRFSRIMALSLGMLAVADIFPVRMAHITGLEGQFVIFAICGPLALPQAYTIWRKLDRFSSALCCVQWILLCEAALMPFLIAAGRSPAPLADGLLARADGLIGFSTPAVVRFVRGFPLLVLLSHYAYVVASPLIAVALISPALAGRKRGSEYFVLMGTLCTVLTAALFALLPAIGPWVGSGSVGSGFAPLPEQTQVEGSIRLLKTAREFHLGTGISPVVTFPSFHVIVALVCGLSLWVFRRLRWITAALTAAICISVITTGWHYLTDVIGGIAVVAVADFITRRWLLEKDQANLGSITTSFEGTDSRGKAAFFQAVSPP